MHPLVNPQRAVLEGRIRVGEARQDPGHSVEDQVADRHLGQAEGAGRSP